MPADDELEDDEVVDDEVEDDEGGEFDPYDMLLKYGEEYSHELKEIYKKWRPKQDPAGEPYLLGLLAYMLPPPVLENRYKKCLNFFDALHTKIGRDGKYNDHEFLEHIVKPDNGAKDIQVTLCRAASNAGVWPIPRSNLTSLSREVVEEILTEQLTHAGLVLLFGFLGEASIKAGTQIRIPYPLSKAFLSQRAIVKVCRVPGVFRVKLPGCPLYYNEKLYHGNTNNGMPVYLSSEWFQNNPEDRCQQQQLDSKASSDDYSWSKVNPGKRPVRQNSSSNPEVAPIEPTFCPGVKVTYRQFDDDRLCYLNSFCSALSEFGMKTESRSIHALGCAKPSAASTNDYIHRIVEEYFRGNYQFRRLRDKKKRFDPLRSRCKYPTVVKLKQRGSDAYPHCVTFYRNMIFDSSFKKALKKNRNNLDYICGGRGNYVGVWWSKQLKPVDDSNMYPPN